MGGFGADMSAVRPIFLGTFGVDGTVPVGGGHAFGVGVDAIWREHPDASESVSMQESSAVVHYRWRRPRPRKGWTHWLGFGAGYRQLRVDDGDDDPLLGVVYHHGVNLVFEGGSDTRLDKDTRLGLFMNWTLGCYLSATRDAEDGYVEAYDEPPPAARDVSCIDSSSSTYSGGLRLSMQFK